MIVHGIVSNQNGSLLIVVKKTLKQLMYQQLKALVQNNNHYLNQEFMELF
jgi:hypothetical protein